MPIYEYACLKCSEGFEVILPMSMSDVPQNCPRCENVGKKLISNTSFVLKGDSWPGKAIKVKGQMARKNRRLDAKMADRPSPVTLAPNVNGERTESWADAQKLAGDKGKDTTSYEPLIAKEKANVG